MSGWCRDSLVTEWFDNGESSVCLLFIHPDASVLHERVPELTHQIARLVRPGLTSEVDVIPATDSITLVVACQDKLTETKHIIDKKLQELLTTTEEIETVMHHIPVCYDTRLGTDIELVAEHLEMSVEEVINQHTSQEYRLDMLGFLPGFFYLSGLSPELAIRRKATPALSVAAGSVAIADSMSGIYSLSSPGGWWVIGRTSQQLFNLTENPPVSIQPLDRIRFIEQSFTDWQETRRD